MGYIARYVSARLIFRALLVVLAAVAAFFAGQTGLGS